MLLPIALIAITAVGWRLGANAVLAFWLAYILTRPMGANLGDYLGRARAVVAASAAAAGMQAKNPDR